MTYCLSSSIVYTPVDWNVTNRLRMNKNRPIWLPSVPSHSLIRSISVNSNESNPSRKLIVIHHRGKVYQRRKKRGGLLSLLLSTISRLYANKIDIGFLFSVHIATATNTPSFTSPFIFSHSTGSRGKNQLPTKWRKRSSLSSIRFDFYRRAPLLLPIGKPRACSTAVAQVDS